MNQYYSSVRGFGKSDVVLIAVIAIVVMAAFLVTLFQIVNQSEKHVEKVKKTKVSYVDALQWHPEEADCDVSIKADLEKNPDVTSRRYSRYDLTEDSLKNISRMRKLRSLSLKESTIKDEWLVYLEKLPLGFLSLYGTKVSDAGVPHLAKIKTLHQLILTDTDVTDASMEALSTLPKLDNLQLTRTKVTDNGITILHKGASKLTKLELSDSKVTAQCLATIGSFPNLTRIELAGIDLEPKDLAHLSRQIVELTAVRCGIDDNDAKAISEFKTLVYLCVDQNPLSDTGLAYLKQNDKLLNLQIRGCPNVSARAVAELQKALPKCEITHTSKIDQRIKLGDGVLDDI